MTLLRLSPDSERLRRIAKAHAAGELSTPDYRRIRAEVIERFSSGEAEQFDDDTQPRWFDRPIPAAQPSLAPVPTDVPRSSATTRVVVGIGGVGHRDRGVRVGGRVEQYDSAGKAARP